MSAAGEKVLEVEHLETYFYTRDGVIKAVNDVSFSLGKGETLGIVGESGCGKSVTALSVMRLVQEPGRVVGGSIRLENENLLTLSQERMREIRGNEMSMIFQEPMTSLNPVITIGQQVGESLVLHQGMSKAAALERAVEMLDLVRIPEARQRSREYPHQLSGGMRQRVMIAMALACNPKILIADEPTTALDVTIQAQILELIVELQRELGTAVILITHDLGVVAETAERVVVMYAGKKVEETDVYTLFKGPLHPYTKGLLSSIPQLAIIGDQGGGKTGGGKTKKRLTEIPGIVPPLTELPSGCAFAPRCPYADEQCRQAYPPYEAHGDDHYAACWHVDQLRGVSHG